MKRPAASKPAQKSKKQKSIGHTKDEDKDDARLEEPEKKEAG